MRETETLYLVSLQPAAPTKIAMKIRAFNPAPLEVTLARIQTNRFDLEGTPALAFQEHKHRAREGRMTN